MTINLIDARRGLYNKCLELFADKNIAERIYRYLCDGIEDCEEVESVKHGTWGENIYGYRKCSVCGRVTQVDECMREPLYLYCPYCGADMQSTMGQVKHGHWVKYGSPLFSEWECSECGERHTGNDLPDECPHCKARMDGGENEL